MGNFIRENIAKREMLAGKKEVILIETKPSWELLAALYPDIGVREAPVHETHMSLRTEWAKWADGELFFPTLFILGHEINPWSKSQENSPTDPSTAWKKQFSFSVLSFQTLTQIHRYRRGCRAGAEHPQSDAVGEEKASTTSAPAVWSSWE